MISDSEAQAAADRAEEDMERLIEDAKKWRNAMQGEQKCGNCRFWYLEDENEENDGYFDSGMCLRYPPVFVAVDLADNTAGYDFPRTSRGQWCGEWQPAQQKGGKDG